MMQKTIALSFCVMLVFLVFKFLEMKYIDKTTKPLKLVLRDAFIVLISSVVCLFLFFQFETYFMEFFNVVTENSALHVAKKVDVFVGEPGF